MARAPLRLDRPGARSTMLFSLGFACVTCIAFLLAGGFFDWTYMNNQEFAVGFSSDLVSYLQSYVSGFLIAGAEIAGGIYLLRRYCLEVTTRWTLLVPVVLGAVASLAYVVAEFSSGLSLLGGTGPGFPQLFLLGLSPKSVDYGNALIIGLSVLSLVLLLRTMFAVNPIRRETKSRSPSMTQKAPGLFGGVWAGLVTMASATLCCGPLPGVIALGTGISSLYFTTLINLQPLLVLIGLPFLITAVVLADRRANSSCQFRR